VGASGAPQRVKGHSRQLRRALGHRSSPSSLAAPVLVVSSKELPTSPPPVPAGALPRPLTGRDLRTVDLGWQPQPAGRQLLEPRHPGIGCTSNHRYRGVQHPRTPAVLSAVLAHRPHADHGLSYSPSPLPHRPRVLALLPNCQAPGHAVILSGLAWVWAAPNYWPPGTLGREGAGIGMRVREVVTTIG
jgi:hypothetical protein